MLRHTTSSTPTPSPTIVTASILMAMIVLLGRTPTAHACSCNIEGIQVAGSFDQLPVVVSGAMGDEVFCDEKGKGRGRRGLHHHLRGHDHDENEQEQERFLQLDYYEEPAPYRYFVFQFNKGNVFKGCDSQDIFTGKDIRFKGPGLIRTAGDGARCGFDSFTADVPYILFGTVSAETVCGKRYTVVEVGTCSATQPLAALTADEMLFLTENTNCDIKGGGKP